MYGVGNRIEVEENPHMHDTAGHHIFHVKLTDDLLVCSAEKFVEIFIFININECYYVSKVPNHFGYGVLK